MVTTYEANAKTALEKLTQRQLKALTDLLEARRENNIAKICEIAAKISSDDCQAITTVFDTVLEADEPLK